MVEYGMAADFLSWRHRKSWPRSHAVSEVALAKIPIKPVGDFTSRRPETPFGNEPDGLVHAALLRVFARCWVERLRRWQAGQVYPATCPLHGRWRSVGTQIWTLHKFLTPPAHRTRQR
jgi:hypothetical protein